MTDPTTTAIAALRDCAAVSTNCAALMTRSGGMPDEVLLALDCADVCEATARVLTRATAVTDAVTALVTAATASCEASAAACGRHADHHEHCRVHSASAAACAEALRAI